MKILFWLNKETIYCRITVDGKRVEISTRLKASNLHNGRTGDSITDTQLAEIEFKIRKAYLVLSMTSEPFDALDIKNAYENSQPKAPKVYRILDVMADKDRIYKATTSKLKAFLGKKNPKLKDLDQDFIDSFARYLEETHKPGTVKIYLSKVFASISPYMDEILFKMPDITIERDETPKYLTLSQFEALNELDLDDRFYLDCFLFQCISGMSMVDLNNFDGKLQLTIKGEKYISYRRVKTNTEAIIPSNKEIESMLGIFPLTLTERKYNYHLKQIGNKVGFKNMTSHVGRKTFGTLKLIEGFSMESISKQLGHTSISMTEKIYAKITLEKLFKEQKQISV